MKVRIRVPASAANLGPGFDRLGLALPLYLSVEARASDRWDLVNQGLGADVLPVNGDNVIIQAYHQAIDAWGIAARPFSLRVSNQIPIASGLGSSAAARVAGVALAGIADRFSQDRNAIFAAAAEIEGHPDNVAPAVFGGLMDCAPQPNGGWRSRTRPIDPRVTLIVVTFRAQASTQAMRALLPDRVDDDLRRKTEELVNRLLCGLRTADPYGLKASTYDLRHQPYRLPALPQSQRVFNELAEDARLSGAFLSGSGPTICAWSLGDDSELDGISRRLQTLGLDALEVRRLQPDVGGLVVEELDADL